MSSNALRALLLTALFWAAGAVAQPGPATWPATDGEAPRDQDLPGWDCVQSVALPTAMQQVALCRHTGQRASAELHLLLVDRKRPGLPRLRELAHLRDASQARMRLFTTEPTCLDSARYCLAAILLLDQRDESSCYGTQVVVVPASQPARAIGFINEVRGGDETGACIGPWTEVRPAPGGAVVYLPAPLMTTGRDAELRPLAVPGVEYHIAAARSALKRKALAPR